MALPAKLRNYYDKGLCYLKVIQFQTNQICPKLNHCKISQANKKIKANVGMGPLQGEKALLVGQNYANGASNSHLESIASGFYALSVSIFISKYHGPPK